MFFYKNEEQGGIAYSMRWFEKDEDAEVSMREREILETFVELAQNILDGKVRREVLPENLRGLNFK